MARTVVLESNGSSTISLACNPGPVSKPCPSFLICRRGTVIAMPISTCLTWWLNQWLSVNYQNSKYLAYTYDKHWISGFVIIWLIVITIIILVCHELSPSLKTPVAHICIWQWLHTAFRFYSSSYTYVLCQSGYYKFPKCKDHSSSAFLSIQYLKVSQMQKHNKYLLLTTIQKIFINLLSSTFTWTVLSPSQWSWLMSGEVPGMCLTIFLLKKRKKLLPNTLKF